MSRCLSAVLFALASLPALHAQGLTGQLSGSVQDTSGAMAAGAKAVLVNANTGQIRETVTDVQGAFLFTQLLPGAYDLTVTLAGFKQHEQKGIAVTATERVVLRGIVLELYNAFNHTQFNAVDTGARFDANDRQVNARFGEYTGAATARRIQLGLKLYF